MAIAPMDDPSRLGAPPQRSLVSSASFQLDNKNIGPVFALRCLSKHVFPVGREHEEASILRNIPSRARPEAIPGGAIGVGKPPNLGSLPVGLRTVDFIFPRPVHQ